MAEMRKDLAVMEVENERLRATMKDMVENYSQQLQMRDETIRQLEQGDIAR